VSASTANTGPPWLITLADFGFNGGSAFDCGALATPFVSSKFDNLPDIYSRFNKALKGSPRGLSGLGDFGRINPSQVRFSQSSVRPGLGGGGTIDDLSSGLRSGAIDPGDVPAIRILERDGQIFTLDNRRLVAFQNAGVDIPYVLATDAEIAAETWKFTTKNGGTSIRIRGGG